MKNLILIALLFLFYSCEKEDNCMQCNAVVITTYDDGRRFVDEYPAKLYCDAELEQYLSAETEIVNWWIDGQNVNIKRSFECK